MTKAKHPITQQPVKAVFIPDLKEGHWHGEIGNSVSIQHDQELDNDADAIREGQIESTRQQKEQALLAGVPQTFGSCMKEADAKLEEEERKRKLSLEEAVGETNAEGSESKVARKRRKVDDDDEEP